MLTYCTLEIIQHIHHAAKSCIFEDSIKGAQKRIMQLCWRTKDAGIRKLAVNKQNIMSNLLKHIEILNKIFIDEIINAIIDDFDWLVDIGISKSEINNKELIKDYITIYLSNSENKEKIDLLLRYVISDFLMDNNRIPLIRHHVSADSYDSTSALFVLKCSDLYFCYLAKDVIESNITEDPELFCRNSAKSIIDFYLLQKDGLDDEYWEDSDTINSLELNFNFL